ncbi:hypothetical protein ABFA07_019331 [Porites harrisoni]
MKTLWRHQISFTAEQTILVVVLHAKITGLVNQDLPRKDIAACVEAGQVQTAKWILTNVMKTVTSVARTQIVKTQRDLTDATARLDSMEMDTTAQISTNVKKN